LSVVFRIVLGLMIVIMGQRIMDLGHRQIAIMLFIYLFWAGPVRDVLQWRASFP
jgi:hypothetical protein